MKKLFTLLMAILLVNQWIDAQVTGYVFSQQSGTYTPLSSETVLWSGTFGLQVSTIVIPEFIFNEVTYTSLAVSSNGYISFGSTLPSNTNNAPISSTETYDGVISAFGQTLENAYSGFPQVSYNLNDGGDIVLQWQDVKRQSVIGDVVNFQIRLTPVTGMIKIIYGSVTTSYASTSYALQVGLRGNAQSDYNNRTTTTDWSATTAGTSNSQTCRFNNLIYPSSGLIFQWESLHNPSDFLATGINLSEIDLSWNLNTSAYPVILASNTTTSFGIPVNGSSYSAGNPITGGGTVIYAGSAAGFNHTDLNNSTNYYYKIWSYNSSNFYSSGLTASSRTATALPYIQEFTSTSVPPGWSFSTNMSIPSSPRHGTNGSYGMAGHLSNAAPVYATSLLTGSISSNTYLSFNYRIMDYYAYPYAATTLGSGDNIQVQISTDDGATFTSIQTIDQSNHITTTEFASVGISLVAYNAAFIKVRFLCTWSSGDYYVDLDNIRIEENNNMVYSGATTEQSNTSNIAIGSTNNDIIRLGVLTQKENNPLSLTSITFNTTGSTNTTNDIAAAKVYYTTGPEFSTGTQFGTTLNNPSGTFSITGTQQLVAGNNYFWLAYDLKPTATSGNSVDAQCTLFLTSESGTNITPTVTNPTGVRKIGAGLGGNKTIPGDYATIAEAVTALNTGALGTGGITFEVAAGHTESSGVAIVLTATGSAASPIVFQKSGSGANPLVSRTDAGTVNTTTLGFHGDGIIIIEGSDYVTFDGIDVTASDQGIEYGYYLRKASTTDGCMNVTLKNSGITMTKGISRYVAGFCSANNSSTGSSTNITSPAGAHQNLVFTGNTISNVFVGVYLKGHDTYKDVNLTIGASSAGNTIQNYGGNAANETYGIYLDNINRANISYNTLNNIANGGSGFTNIGYGIYNYGAETVPFTANYNTISLSSQGGAYELYGISNRVDGEVQIEHNSIALTNSAASSRAYYYIYNEPYAASANNISISSNSFSGEFNNTLSIYLIYNKNSQISPATVSIQNNTTSGTITRTSTTTGYFYLYYNNGSPTGTEIISGNNFSNISQAGTSRFYGIQSLTAATHNLQVHGNTFSNISNGSNPLTILEMSSSTNRSVYNNTFQQISSGGTITIINNGIGNATCHIYKNLITNITTSSTDGTFGLLNGILIGYGTNVYIYNNFISDLKTPASSSADAIRAISLTSTQANSTIGLYFNTVYLHAISTGSSFGTTAVYHVSQSNTTTALLDMRNNILINKSEPKSGGRAVVLRRSNSSLMNFAESSNNNILYAGTPGFWNNIYYSNTGYQTLENYQALVTPRETNSFTEDTPFANVSVVPYNMHIPDGTASLAEGSAQTITSPFAITEDYDGNTRLSSPDIGADEFAGVSAFIENPPEFKAVAGSSKQNKLSFTQNASNNDVVIIFNSTGVFTIPVGTPEIGQPLASGTVIYSGSTSPFWHGGLTMGTTYYYKAYSWNGVSFSTGITSNAAPAVDAVSDFAAVAENQTVMNLAWVKNAAGHEVVVAANNAYMNGNPVNGTAYEVGHSIPSGGTIIYKGPASSFEQTALTTWSQYYYKCWSVDAFNYYSTSSIDNAVTYAEPVTSIPYLQNFDQTWSHSPAAPQGWEVTDNNGSGTFTWVKAGNLSKSAPYSAQGLGRDACDDYLISPPIILPDNDLQLSWYDKVSTTTNTSRYKVLISTTGKETSDFTTVLGDYTCNATSWALHTLSLNAYKGQNIHLAFYQYYTSSQYAYFAIDDILVETLIPGPASLVAPIDNLLTLPTAQTLTWKAPASSYALTYKLYFGINPGIQELVYTGPLTSWTTGVLAYNTSYTWKVIPENINGPAENVPEWSFTTVTSTQLAESFEDSWFPPIGWTNSWFGYSDSHFHGIQSASCYTTLSPRRFITPKLSVKQGDKLEFFAGTAASTYQRIQISYSEEKVIWTDLGAPFEIIPASWNQYVQDLSSLAGNNYYFSISVYFAQGGIGTSVYLDHVTGPDIIILAPDNANTPFPADGSEWLPLSTQLTWLPGIDGGVPTSYKVYMGTDGNGTSRPSNLVNGTETTILFFTPPTLSDNTTWYWQIVPTNAIGNASNCPIWSFSTAPEDGVQIGSEDIDYDLPIDPGYSYNYSQILYLQSEINIAAKSISKIYYQWSGGAGGEACKDWVIYMGHTSKTAFSSTSDWVPYADMIEVFKGEVALPVTEGWIEIILDYPFPFNNTDNLVIAVDENTDEYASWINFYGSETTTKRSLQLYNDISDPDPTSPNEADHMADGIANIRLLLDVPSACPLPYSLEATNITDVSADLSWESSQLTFDIEVVPAGQNPTGTPTALNVASPYTVSGLFSATDYRFYVRANCGIDGYSDWRRSDIFTTDICDLGNRCNYFVQLYDQGGDGWNGAQLGLVQNGYTAKVFGPGFIDGFTYGPIYVPVCNGVKSDLVVYNLGYHPEGIHLEIFDTDNILIYTLEFGSEFQEGDILFSFTSSCSGAGDNEFTGLTNSYWSNPLNWSTGVVPNHNSAVVINSPKNLIVDLPNAICRKLNIKDGGRLTIDPAKAITVLNGLRNDSDEPGLIIRSDATGTGSLWCPYGGVKATFERYLEAADWANSADGWHHISSPVIGVPIAYEWTPTGEGNDYDFYLWSSGTAMWLNQKDPLNDITYFEEAVGYCVAYQQTKTQQFRGELFIGEHSSNLSITTNSWIPMGNPYPCALQWNTIGYMLDGYAEIAKVWNRSNKSYDDIFRYGIIPATNGFMAYGEAIGTLVTIQMNMPSNARMISPTPFYKSQNINKGIFLRVSDLTGKSSQESCILQDEDAGNTFNIHSDSKFLPGYAPAFYSLKSGEKLSVYGVTNITQGREIPFGFEKTENSQYVLEFLNEKSVSLPNIFLVDHKVNVTHCLSKETSYSFTSEDGDSPYRFTIYYGNVGMSEPAETAHVSIWQSGNEIFVQSESRFSTIELFDLQGRIVLYQQAKTGTLWSFHHTLPEGIYLVRLSGNEGLFNSKLLLK